MFIVCKPTVKNVGAVPASMVCLLTHVPSPRSVCVGFMMNRMTHWDWFLSKNFSFLIAGNLYYIYLPLTLCSLRNTGVLLNFEGMSDIYWR